MSTVMVFPTNKQTDAEGMTLKDYFAGCALTGILAEGRLQLPDAVLKANQAAALMLLGRAK